MTRIPLFLENSFGLLAAHEMTQLPVFRNPPVHEVVMGVQFSRLEAFHIPYFGLFWAELGSDYSACSENPPIMPQIEDFQTQGRIAGSEFDPTEPRIFFFQPELPWVLQLQRDRFLHNWRMAKDPYPRYETVKLRFQTNWSKFNQFVEKKNLGRLNVAQLEITYLNRITPWPVGAKFSSVFPDLQWRSGDRALTEPDSYNFSWATTAENKRSRLRIRSQTIIDHLGERALHLELTVRGIQNGESMEDWFDAGRSWIVRAFADITSSDWHNRWERTV